jgi:MFS family permease
MSEQFQKRSLAAPIYLPSLLITGAEGALLPILPVTAVGYGFSLAEAGIVAAVLMIGTLVFEIPASYLTNRIGERNTMVLGAAMGVIAGVLAFFHLGYFSLLLSALLFGAGHALFGLARHSVLAELVPAEHRPRSMSLLGGMFRGGMAIGPVIGAAFISLYGVESGYLAVALMCLLAGLSVFTVPVHRLTTPPSGLGGNVWQVAKKHSKELMTLGVASSIINAGRTIRMVGLPLLAIQLSIDPAQTSFIFGVTGFIDFALFYLSGIVMDKYGKFWASVPTLLALGLTYLFSFMVVDVTAFWILAAVTALANAMSAGINMILGADMAPAGSRSEFLAAFRILTSGGVAVAPAMISSLTAIVGLSSALAATGLLNFVGAYLFWKYLPIYAPDRLRK